MVQFSGRLDPVAIDYKFKQKTPGKATAAAGVFHQHSEDGTAVHGKAAGLLAAPVAKIVPQEQ